LYETENGKEMGPEEEIKFLRSKLQEKQRLEEQLIQAQKMESLANLSAGIAHDFNNILQSILGYTQLALISREDDRHLETFRQIEKIVGKGRQLTEQFLTFGRKKMPSLSSLDLNQKIQDLLTLFRRTIPGMIDIEVNLSSDLKPVRADAGQIEQVLMNLAINAKDAMPHGGRLSFKTKNTQNGAEPPFPDGSRKGGYVLLSITDTGHGIPPQHMKRIYEPFFTTKPSGKGTGLGLAMVYAIVKNHGGTIECASKVGEGTTFSIYFPALERTSGEKDPQRSPETEKGSAGTETILLVEDDMDILRPQGDILRKWGYRVIAVENGEKALEVYSSADVDLVVLDVGMPGMGGVKCLEEIRRLDHTAKVIISSGFPFSKASTKALSCNAAGFLPKPYHASELLKTVRRTLDRHTESPPT
jgi:two-component system, cell cycle sensor histidine kinase and response regulator CckA